jgi:MYXO-CTERM domain-containing protein
VKALIAAFALALFAPAIAQADVISPDPVRDACGGKKAGETCTLDGKPGACKASKCSRKVGGVLNPSVIEEECMVCDATATAKTAEPPTPTPAKTDEPKPEPTPSEGPPSEPTPEPTKAEPAKAEPAKVEPAKAEPAKTETKAETKAESKGGICSVGTDATPLASFAMGVLLLALARRRRCG